METFIIFGNGFGKPQRTRGQQQLSVPSASSVVTLLCHNPARSENQVIYHRGGSRRETIFNLLRSSAHSAVESAGMAISLEQSTVPHNPSPPGEIKKPHFVVVTIMSDIRVIRTIHTIRVLMLLILNKIYNTNFTNAANVTNLTLIELWGLYEQFWIG